MIVTLGILDALEAADALHDARAEAAGGSLSHGSAQGDATIVSSYSKSWSNPAFCVGKQS